MRSITQKEINASLQMMSRIDKSIQLELNEINSDVELALYGIIKTRQYPFHVEVWPATNDVIYFGATVKVAPAQGGWYNYLAIQFVMEPEKYPGALDAEQNADEVAADFLSNADFRAYYFDMQGRFAKLQERKNLIRAGMKGLQAIRKTGSK